MDYSCRIADDLLHCVITADRDLAAPVFCFSGMAPMRPVEGGELLKECGSYTEVVLPDLRPGQPHHLTIRYDGGYRAVNRAWMPLGPYLRSGGQVIPLPATPSGRRASAAPQAPLNGLPVIPQPTQWAPTGGQLDCDGFDCAALADVAALADRQGMRWRGAMPIQIKEVDLPDAAYRITITGTGVTVEAGTDTGVFYAGITLLQLLQHGPLPCGLISDQPRFDWRGQHLDCARHYYTPQSIMALLDLMALMKLNRFHWHFADDEAFRLEITSLPELWQKTAQCGEGQMLPGLFTGAPVQGGSYALATARDIIAHAASLHINVMPEIEAPAHALALTTLYPDTRDPDDTGGERSVQGYARNVLNPAMPRTWEVLETLVAEVGGLFPFGCLHLGGDELPQDTWMGSPRARALMAREGLQTTQDLQGWMMAKLAGFARDCGLRPAAWEEAALGCQGGIGHDALLFSWTGQGPGLDAARAGYDVVMTPAQHVYLDMAHTGDPDDWGAAWAAFVDLPDTISWDPVPDPTIAARIKGVQGAFWSEFTTSDHQMWPMLIPRILGVAAMAWQDQPPTVDWLGAMAGRFAIPDQGRVSITPR